MFISDQIGVFIAYLRDQKGYSQHTIRNYRIDLTQFSEFLVSREALPDGQEVDQDMEAIDALVIREYLGSLFGRFARSTIARKLSAVRSFFLFLEKKGIVMTNPAGDIATPKLGKYIPVYLPVDDVFRLLERKKKKKPLGLRDLAILEVLYSCGIRVSELEALDISGVDFEERLVTVIGKGDRERIVPIGRI
ncbi:MAG: site-specific integrase, partial [Deltaproteobacteria bacterium]|nr:site-specific integrase [Deltaproteobacteria bacterium]